jgi:squalene-associated FAD-dependent desaturase
MPTPSQPTVAIAGGGLAGLAAACALSDAGFRVTLFERRPFLGGRASSYEHPGTGEVVDNCQHVLFRVCTNLVEFYQRIGVADQIRWYDQMNFIEPGGRISVMKSSPLPAPMHTAPSFFQFPFLSAADKLAIARALVPLTLTTQRDTGKSFLDWLHRHHQTPNAIARFWYPILVSALSEELDRISISAAAQVVRESMKSPAARHMGVPTVPLTDLYNQAGDYIRARGGTLHFRQPVEGFVPDSSGILLQLRNSQENPAGAPLLADFARSGDFDYLILALSFDTLDHILPNKPESQPLREQISHFENSPITGIHLWFDRQISDLDHAVLLDRTIQWMFHKSRLQPMRTEAKRERNENNFGWRSASSAAIAPDPETGALASEVPSYIELVVSSSKNLLEKSRTEIVDLALAEVREFFPAARAANLVKSTVIKEVNATYSPRPGSDAHRPTPITPWPRVFLAGDWTATGWPATMEGAVRSGYLAAEALARAAGRPSRFVSPDLPASGLMSLFT